MGFQPTQPSQPKTSTANPLVLAATSQRVLLPSVETSVGTWQLLNRARIWQKISAGYALAVGIAIVGTGIGLALGDRYHNQAQNQLTQAIQQEQLLQEFQRNVLHMRLHQHEFIPLATNPRLFKAKYDHFLTHIHKIEEILPELTVSAENTAALELQRFLQPSAEIAAVYSARMEGLLQEVYPLVLQQTNLSLVQAEILEFTTAEIALQFDGLLNDLVKLIQRSQRQQDQAEVALEQARLLRLQSIGLSLVLSVAIAVLFALYNSRAIARPIEAVTQVAQQAAKESNFTIQAPVTTGDEVGTLAVSLNHLIQRVAQYTQELEVSRQTLEHRVEERTEELWRKNEQLEDAHTHLQELNLELVAQAQDLGKALQDLQKAQGQLIQTEKMSSLGQMVAGVAHEINNPVSFIHGNLKYVESYVQDLVALVNLYQEAYPEPTPVVQTHIQAIDLDFLVEDLPKTLNSMKMGSERIRQIVLSLRNFSRLDEADMKPADLHEGLDNTLLILGHRLKQGIQVVKHYGEIPLIACYPAQLNQVFMNLLSNAIDALEGAGTPENPTSAVSSNLGTIEITTAIAPDPGAVRITVRDNGPGISPEVQAKLFDPFFTTKPVGQGTGLGLSICYQIIQKHQGSIEVNSAVGKGTEFVISLPIQAPTY